MTLQGWEILDAISAFYFDGVQKVGTLHVVPVQVHICRVIIYCRKEFLFIDFFSLWYWDSSSISHAGQVVYSRATQPALLLEKWVTELGHRVSWRWRTRKEFCTILKISLYQFAIIIQMKDQFAKPFGTEWNLPPNNEAELITMSLQWF